jgi:hypothetical protein
MSPAGALLISYLLSIPVNINSFCVPVPGIYFCLPLFHIQSLKFIEAPFLESFIDPRSKEPPRFGTLFTTCTTEESGSTMQRGKHGGK